tara:strand:- start:12368 stop:12799 length:432 start_codon:yes stop_codon:yes gene_type:complete
MKIAIGCDHAGFDLKEEIISKYTEYEFVDCGAFSTKSVDYPEFGHKVGLCVLDANQKSCSTGIVICGSGIGISIAANKIKGIRAALCHTVDHARLSRLHNDANILALGSRLTEKKIIYEIIDSFLNTEFEGNRHQNRINKIEL